MYIRKLQGVAFSRRYQRYIPTSDVYQDVMDILDDKTKESAEQKRMAREYRERILGKTSMKNAHPEYWNIGMITEMGIPPHVWKAYPVHDKAQITARHYIKNMVEIIDAYYKDQDEARKKK